MINSQKVWTNLKEQLLLVWELSNTYQNVKKDLLNYETFLQVFTIGERRKKFRVFSFFAAYQSFVWNTNLKSNLKC